MSRKNSQVLRYMYQKAARNKIPFGGTFELTPCCNMNCKMCYVRMSKEEQAKTGRRELTADEWISYANDASKLGMMTLLLTGGEPFLREDLEEISAKVQEKGIMVNMNSNATLINEKTIQWLKKNPPARVNVTLYGSSNKSYERLCGNPGGYDQAVRGIHLLREAGIYVSINLSLTPDNVNDMQEIFQFADGLGLAVKPAAYMFPPVRKPEWETIPSVRFEPEEAGVHQIKADLLKLGEERFHQRVCSLHEGIMCIDEEDECGRGTNPMSCMAGKASFWMTWDGRMLPCGMMQTPCFYPAETSFAKAWQDVVNAIETAEINSPCLSCKKRIACPTCRALLMAENGNLTDRPEYLCRMTDAYLKENERIYQTF